jgi:hypothetical protein
MGDVGTVIVTGLAFDKKGVKADSFTYNVNAGSRSEVYDDL